MSPPPSRHLPSPPRAAAARKQIKQALKEKVQASKPQVASGLTPRQEAAADRLLAVVSGLAEAHLSKAPEERPGSQACCFRETDRLEALLRSSTRDVLRKAMQGGVNGCPCCPKGLALAPTLPPIAAFWRMVQSRGDSVAAGDLIQARVVPGGAAACGLRRRHLSPPASSAERQSLTPSAPPPTNIAGVG